MDNKKLIMNFLLGIAPEFLIAFIIATFQEYDQIQTFFIALAVIYGVYFIIWLKSTIWEWVLYSFGGKEQIADTIYEFLKSNNFPDPYVVAEDNYEGQTRFEEYLKFVILSNDVPHEIKLKASAQLGSIQTLVDVVQYQRRIRFDMGANTGMTKFRDDFLDGLRPTKDLVGVKV